MKHTESRLPAPSVSAGQARATAFLETPQNKNAAAFWSMAPQSGEAAPL